MKHFIFVTLLLSCNAAFAWDGTDQYNNTVEIEKGNLVRSENNIEVYVNGEYKNVEVQSINNHGAGVEIEVYDYNTGEYNTYDMD